MNALDGVRVALRATVQICILAIGSLPRMREVSVHHSDVISSLAEEASTHPAAAQAPPPPPGPTSDSHAWLGSRHQDHAQGDALVQIPLLHGGRHTDDTHQQQCGVLEVLSRHL